MTKLLRLGILWVLSSGCATAEDVGSASFDASATDTTTVEGGAETATDSGNPESGEETAVDSGAAVDATMPDSAPVDTGTADSALVDTGTDTEPLDTGTADTGTVDTGPPVCGATDKYGPKCKTNLDCAAITGCGYVCCAFDPILMTNLGCGRTSFGTTCLP